MTFIRKAQGYAYAYSCSEQSVQRAGLPQLIHPLRVPSLQMHQFLCLPGCEVRGGGVSAQRGHAAPAKGQLDLALDMLVYLQPGIPTPSAITAARTERKYTYNQVKFIEGLSRIAASASASASAMLLARCSLLLLLLRDDRDEHKDLLEGCLTAQASTGCDKWTLCAGVHSPPPPRRCWTTALR